MNASLLDAAVTAWAEVPLEPVPPLPPPPPPPPPLLLDGGAVVVVVEPPPATAITGAMGDALGVWVVIPAGVMVLFG